MNCDREEKVCAICLQKYHHPTQLPCGHIFCFLCVKGIAIVSKKCAFCRAQIPSDYLDNPVLLEDTLSEQNIQNEDPDVYQWYYEGRNGWWKYDERSNKELETAYNSGKTEYQLLLAGALYRIDFQGMMQIRVNDRTRRRKVRRDIPSLPAKGVAGIKQFETRQEENTEGVNDVNSNSLDGYENFNEVIEIDVEDYTVDNVSPNIVPLQPESDVIDLTESLSNVSLQEESTRDSSR